MNTVTATHPSRRGRTLTFSRHLFEMTVAMLVGMAAYGLTLGFAAENARLAQPELFALGMAASMTITMVAWMLHRGHGWRNSGEMAAAMFAPVAVLLVCYWLGMTPADAICPLACALMIPAMAAAMLVRRDTYMGDA
jgi:hypothetical protein